MSSSGSSPPDWEIFCRVVDNFGDIGLSWRLARELAARTGDRVRLWVDDWNALQRVCPAASTASATSAQCGAPITVQGVQLRPWAEPFPHVVPARVVIEAFACELPPRHLEAMLQCEPAPHWINLEYLSAEEWIDDWHGLSSPHPRLALTKHFFFPGFSARSGGLLREHDLLGRRDAFRHDPDGRRAWRGTRGASEDDCGLCISLFSYTQPELDELFALWRQSAVPLHVVVPEGRVLEDVGRALGRPALSAGMRIRQGSLAVEILPFSGQDDYDRLLWACDLNFVRGEDSLVRGQWAANPIVWQAYPQQDEAHVVKLKAFMQRYLHGLEPAQAAAVRDFWLAWNGDGQLARSWPPFIALLPALQDQAAQWARQQAAEEDLVSRLLRFCCHIEHARG